MSQADNVWVARLTLANALSVTRLILLAPLFWAVEQQAGVLSVTVFVLVVASDVLDGKLARRAAQVSRFGTLLDHGCDAVFVAASAALLSTHGLVPMLLPVVIAIAFTQYARDGRAAASAAPRPSQMGRWNGIGYYVVVGVALVAHHFLAGTLVQTVLLVLCWMLIATTLSSIVERAVFSWRHRLRG
jgi:phosphatidylglycerophosphate synthase